jgi:multimeric flavodoxin WrbA
MLSLKILGISGSPRSGNSEYLLGKALEKACTYKGASITAKAYSFRAKEFKPCIGCNHCIRNKGACVHKDDFKELADLWHEADVILYSLPVYHMSMPGQVKCFLDRLGNSSFGAYAARLPDGREILAKQYKIIGTIAQGIHNFSGQEHTITDMINHALIMQSIPVTGDMWECYIGAGAWTSNGADRDAFEKLASNGDFAAQAAIRGSESLGLRAVEMADIILQGLIQKKEQLCNNPAYSYIYQRIEDKHDSKDARG